VRRRHLLLLLVTVGLAACASGIPPERVQAWVGRPATDLRNAWGTPTREVTDGDQRILIYDEYERISGADFQRQVGVRAAGSAQAAMEVNNALQAQGYARSYLFWVNPAGVIVRSEIRQP